MVGRVKLPWLTSIRGNVINDGPLVGVGPCAPVQGDGVTSIGRDEIRASSGRLVAGDVGGPKG